MKKLIVSVMMLGLAVAVQAGETKANVQKEVPACCAKAKATADAKGQCPMMSKQAKATCPYASKTACKRAPVKQALLSPKDAAQAAR